MKTIKIIDLLNKIANGEEVPKRIKYKGIIREYNADDKDYRSYEGNEELYLFYGVLTSKTGEKLKESLNDEVEILDEPKEDKIEKLNDILRIDDIEPPYDSNLEKIWVQTIKNHNKINEIIDKLNKEE